MPWTTIQAPAASIDDEIETFAGTVTSIGDVNITSIGSNRIIAVIEYSA